MSRSASLYISAAIAAVVFIIILVYIKFLYRSTAHGYPSTLKRLFAFTFDMILVNITVISIGFFYLLMNGDLVETFTDYTDRLNTATDSSYHPGVRTLKLDFFLLQCFNVMVYSLYNLVLELFKKVSLGKKFMGIEYHYDKIWQPIVRNIMRIAIFSTIPFYMNPTWSDTSWWWPIWGFGLFSMVFPRRRWIHDLLSKSTLTSKRV